MGQELQVDRQDVAQHRIVERPAAHVDDGQVRIRVERFAFTTNNITYGVAGDALGYWSFFPPADDPDGRWGILPVWGFGDVVESRSPDVPVGDRVYGYLPPATDVVMLPTRISPGTWHDGSAHRDAAAAVYNRYQRVHADPAYQTADDDLTALLQPLLLTGFALDDRLTSAGYHDAEQIVILSASSKTALGLAHALHDHHTPTVVGVTSARNVDAVRRVGRYDRVLAYDEIETDLPARRTVVVDMAGDDGVVTALRDRLGADLLVRIVVGVTHRDATGAGGGPTGERDQLFFAPTYLPQMVERHGPEEVGRRSGAFLADAMTAFAAWLDVERLGSLAAFAERYPDVCAGQLPPTTGLIVEP